MFIGHFGTAFACKRWAPDTSLGKLFFATIFLDLLWAFFLVFGWERVRIDPGHTAVAPLDFYDFPYTHSLAAAALWAVILGIFFFRGPKKPRVAVAVIALVLSHWILDFISHPPDLPLWPGSPTRVGLGLWNSLPATIIVELGIFAVGIFLYLKATDPHRGKKTWGPWGLVAVLLVIQLQAYFGPPPPNVASIILMGLPGVGILVAWAYWVDRRRAAKAFRSDALFRLEADS